MHEFFGKVVAGLGLRRVKTARLSMLLGLSLSLVLLSYSAGQNAEAGGGNPLTGSWHQMTPAQVGGTIHNFMSFGADGTFFSSSINDGGPQAGLRSQMWGRYTIKPAANGMYLVTMYYKGRAPVQMCMQGMGCRPNGVMPTRPDQGLFQFQGDMLQSNNGFVAQRSGIPPVLMQRLPATWMVQPPPPLNLPSGGATANGGRYVSPRTTTPGLGGNCDDLQQSRICTINDGWYHKDPNTGCMVCSK